MLYPLALCLGNLEQHNCSNDMVNEMTSHAASSLHPRYHTKLILIGFCNKENI